MEWQISLSRQAEKFLAKNHLADTFVTVNYETLILSFLRKQESRKYSQEPGFQLPLE